MDGWRNSKIGQGHHILVKSYIKGFGLTLLTHDCVSINTTCHRGSCFLSAVILVMHSDKDCIAKRITYSRLSCFFIFICYKFWQFPAPDIVRNLHTVTRTITKTHTKGKCFYEFGTVCMQVTESISVAVHFLSLSKVQCVCSVCVPCRVCTRRRNSLAAWSFSPADLK